MLELKSTAALGWWSAANGGGVPNLPCLVGRAPLGPRGGRGPSFGMEVFPTPLLGQGSGVAGPVYECEFMNLGVRHHGLRAV